MRRIQRALDKESIVKSLTGSEASCFREIWRLLIFAATLGFKLGRREPLREIDSGKSIPESYFTNSTAWPGLLFLLGLVQTNETILLHSSDAAENELINVFEEYANGGLSYLQERVASGDNTLPIIIDIISEFSNSSTRNPELSGIVI